MDFIEKLKKSMEDKVVSRHKILLAYEATDYILYAFFEGKTDESFYGTFIRNAMPGGWRLKTFICGNKKGVHHYFKEFSHMHKKEQPFLFFVDKDLDDIMEIESIKDEKMYITEFYSIENYLVTSDIMERVWAEIFKQGSGTEAAEALLKSFQQAHSDSSELLLDVMAWVILHHRQQNELNLDSIKTKDLFSLAEDLTLTRSHTQTALFNYLDTRTNNETDANELLKIKDIRNEISNYKPKAIIRGRNELDFFVEFVKKLKEISANHTNKNFKPSLDLTTKNAMDLLSPRTPIPSSLKSFLEGHFSNEYQLST